VLPNADFYELPMFQGASGEVFVANIFNLQEYSPRLRHQQPALVARLRIWYYVSFPLLMLPLARNYSKVLRYGLRARARDLSAVRFGVAVVPLRLFAMGDWAGGDFAATAADRVAMASLAIYFAG